LDGSKLNFERRYWATGREFQKTDFMVLIKFGCSLTYQILDKT